jgi:predicted Zn-dependent protease
MQWIRHRKVALLFFALLILVVMVDCARNPVTGRRQLVLISEDQEIAYGREAHPEILAQFGEVEDRALVDYVDRIGQRMAQLSHRPDIRWHFTVVDVPVVNAFALPGGYIYLTREILAYMNSEAEMAGVLGHEITHVTARHAVVRLSRAQLVGLGLGLGSVISPTFRQMSEVAEVGVSLLFLSHSRDDERQSDEVGQQYMAEAGYDPREMANFFQVFEQMQAETGQVLPNWLASHPAPPERIENTRAQAEQIIAETNRDWVVGRDTFFQRIQGIVYGENPREGFMQDGMFLHPDLRFQIRFPSGWRVQNTRTAVVAMQPDGAAAIQFTIAREGGTPEQQARRIGAQQGVEMLEGRRTDIHGNPAFIGLYQFLDPGGNRLAAVAAFISFRGNLYQVVGMSSAGNFRRVQGTLEESLTSFRELTDTRALQVQPDRLRIRQARQGETLEAIAAALNNPRVDAARLARLNRMSPTQPLAAGTPVKVVEPGRR